MATAFDDSPEALADSAHAGLRFRLHAPPPADALERLRAFPGGERLPPKPLCALNLTQVEPDTALRVGDELAILPPLSGG